MSAAEGSTPGASRVTTAARQLLSAKAERFTESVIREMTRLAMQHNAVNMAQGFPDFPASAEVKEAARQAIADDINQYAITWGAKELRDAIARKFERTQGVRVDPEREITVTCGSTEAMMATMMGIINPGDEVVIFEPHYENYGPDAILSGATPRFVQLQPPDWSFDRDELTRAFGPRTKAIIVNTPNNPTGKVFSREELEFIRDLCVRWNAFAVTDEIYEHILYDGARHISMASLDGMRDRAITINGMSKTYSVTGWRVGWAIAPPEASVPIRKVHDFLTVGAAAPLQQAGAVALELPASYYDETRGNLSDQARPHARHFGTRRFPLFQAGRRILHHDGHFEFRYSRRYFLRAIPGGTNWNRRGARIEFLRQSVDGRAPGALHILQERIDAGGLRGKTFEAASQIVCVEAPVRPELWQDRQPPAAGVFPKKFRHARDIRIACLLAVTRRPVLESAAKDQENSNGHGIRSHSAGDAGP